MVTVLGQTNARKGEWLGTGKKVNLVEMGATA